ncbi:MAG: ABC transporter ATP-binding protein [Clostridia bacterium]
MIKELKKCIGEYKLPSILASVFVVGEVVLEVLIPLLMAKIIDNGIKVGNISYIVGIGCAMIVMAFFSLVCGALSGKFAATASMGFAKNLRKNMYKNIQSFSFANIDKFTTSSLITRLTTDANYAANAYQMTIRGLFRAPVMFVFSLVMSFVLNAKLALVFLTIIPILVVVIFILLRVAYPLFMKMFTKYDKLNEVVQENLIGIRVVKSYVREEHEINKFEDASEDLLRYSKKAEKVMVVAMPLANFALYACLLAVYFVGGKQIITGGMTEGSFTSFISYVMQILMSLIMISMIFVNLVIARSSLQRITEVLKETSDIKNPENPINEVKNGDIEFKNVSFGYGKDKNILENINLFINSGNTIGVIGGTGSSKSSLVQLIPRLYDAREGEVLLAGNNVKSYDLTVLRDNVAMVLQNNVLFKGTVEENLRWGNKEATQEELENACKKAQAHDFILGLENGYQTQIDQGGVNVSGGQKQRLCIARALLKNPKVIILDDSTSAVDTKTEAKIKSAFNNEMKDITKIIIAQRISSVKQCDKIIVLDKGNLVAYDTHENLIKNCQIYQEVFNSQQKGGIK